LLRPVVDASAQDRLRDVILTAFAEYEEQAEVAKDAGPVEVREVV